MNNGLEQAEKAITEVCETLKASDAIPRAIDAFREFLLAKNRAYGNSIYEPVRVFTNASIETLILVRLNDKATRLLKGESGGEDSFDDMLGYLILRKALPLYLTFDTKEGQDALDLLPFGHTSKPRMVPHSEVQDHLAARGLRVGMTFAEVRDNIWTQCEATQSDADGLPVGRCTEGDPCPACKFLDGALCACGHPYTVHHPAMASFASDCHACSPAAECLDFSLASWPTESLGDVAAEVAAHVNANVDGWTATPSASKRLADAINTNLDGASAAPIEDGSEHGAVTITAAEPKKEPTMADTKKPRVNRAMWHETDHGKAVVADILAIFERNSSRPMYAREVASQFRPSMPLVESDIKLALDHLLTTGAIVKHGKAKGTRYAAAGFADWPAPLPRGKKQDDQFAEEEPSIIIGAHGAT